MRGHAQEGPLEVKLNEHFEQIENVRVEAILIGSARHEGCDFATIVFAGDGWGGGASLKWAPESAVAHIIEDVFVHVRQGDPSP